MMNRYIWADLHLGHNNIDKYRTILRLEDPSLKWTPETIATDHRPKNDIVEMSSEEQSWSQFEKLNSLGKKDMIFLLGDIAFTKEWLERIKKTACRKILIVGNHDLERSISMRDLVDVYDEVYSLYSYKGYWLTHCPIHPNDMRGKRGNIHGHKHANLVLSGDGAGTIDKRYINVCVEFASDPLPWEYAVSEVYRLKCKGEMV